MQTEANNGSHSKLKRKHVCLIIKKNIEKNLCASSCTFVYLRG